MNYCDWDKNPPKDRWDVSRRSVLQSVHDAETKLAQLHSQISELRGYPEYQQILRMMESAREAARKSTEADTILTDYLKVVCPNLFR